MPRMKKTRMRLWAAKMDSIAPGELNMCGWASCAAGHAAMVPEFKAAGLAYNSRRHDVMLERHWGTGAVAKFFGLTEYQACRICIPAEYPSRRNPVTREYDIRPSDVTRRIRAMVARA